MIVSQFCQISTPAAIAAAMPSTIGLAATNLNAVPTKPPSLPSAVLNPPPSLTMPVPALSAPKASRSNALPAPPFTPFSSFGSIVAPTFLAVFPNLPKPVARPLPSLTIPVPALSAPIVRMSNTLPAPPLTPPSILVRFVPPTFVTVFPNCHNVFPVLTTSVPNLMILLAAQSLIRPSRTGPTLSMFCATHSNAPASLPSSASAFGSTFSCAQLNASMAASLNALATGATLVFIQSNA